MKLAQKFAVAYTRTKFRVLSSVSKKRAAEKAFELFCTPQYRNKKPLPPVFEEAERLHFNFQQQRIVGYRWNKGGVRKALIIHGFESSVINFDKYVKPLVKKDYEVLAFDAPAHGRSSGKKITGIIYGDLIREIQSRYGPIQSFMAHSLGGLALCFALAEMKNTEDDRVVLIAPATETITAVHQFYEFLRIDDPEVRKEFEKIISKLGGHPLSWFSIRRAMGKIKAKVLWLHDADDKITPLADAKKVKDENYPNIRFVITRGLGHSKIYRDADIRKAIVTFL